MKTPTATINRHVTSAFWTPKRDKRLQTLQAAGLSAAEIAARLGTTPFAIYRRFYHLRGQVFPSDQVMKETLRVKAAARREEKQRREKAALAAMRAAIARGVPRDIAIAEARNAGASPSGIADALYVSRQLVYRMILLHY